MTAVFWIIAAAVAAAFGYMFYEIATAPTIEEDNAVPDEEREARRISETERQRLERISKLPR